MATAAALPSEGRCHLSPCTPLFHLILVLYLVQYKRDVIFVEYLSRDSLNNFQSVNLKFKVLLALFLSLLKMSDLTSNKTYL